MPPSVGDLRSFIDLIPTALVAIGEGDWRVLHVNEAVRRLVGARNLDESPLPPYFSEWVEAARFDHIVRELDTGREIFGEPLRVRHSGGDWLECIASVSRVDWVGLPALLLGLTDMSAYYRLENEVLQAQARASELMTRLSFQDSLTGLYNRSLLYDRLNHALKRCRRSREVFALLMIDLDGFKSVNDSHGHETGDQVLRTVAGRLTRTVRATDTVARLGGDEFAVLLEGVRGGGEVTPIAEKLIAVVGQPIEVQRRRCRVGASIGIALYPVDGASSDVLLSQADAAMYASKHRGKNTFTFSMERRPEPALRELVPWNDSQMVGNAVIDQQHRVLVEHLNRLFAALTSGEETPLLKGLLNELTDYTAHHFLTEESLMDRFGFEGTPAHKDEHTKMVSDLRTLGDNFERYGLFRTLETAAGFLVNHIHHWDREFVKVLVQKGVR